MPTNVIGQDRLSALENLANASRALERCLAGPFDLPVHPGEVDTAFLEFKAALRRLDHLEGWEMPLGHLHSWQETPPF